MRPARPLACHPRELGWGRTTVVALVGKVGNHAGMGPQQAS